MGRVKQSDVSEQDVAGLMTASFERLDKQMLKNNETIVQQTKDVEALFGAYEKLSQKGIDGVLKKQKALNALMVKAVANEKTAITNAKGLADVKKKEAQAEKAVTLQKAAASKETERLRKIKEREAKATLKARKATLDSINPYKRLVKQTDNAQNRFKRLAAQFGVNSKEARKARKNFERLERKLRQVNGAAKDGRRDVGRYGIATEKMGLSVRKVTGLLARFGLAMGGVALARGAFNVIADFEQGQANLASVLGVNVDGMEALTAQAKELGATTRFTASQVSELQVELAKLGFTQQQIEDMTPATLSLAEATGTELATAAEIAGSTLNAFGLKATDTQRVVDTMAKAFSTSSLDMEKFKTAMAAVAPVAKTMGFSVEETTAMIGNLTDSGLDASTAGTSLRNMMLEASKQGLTWNEALEKVNNSTDKAGTALELFGKRGVAAGVILAENQEKTKKQTELLNKNTEASLRGESAAAKMADTQRNTLGGALDLLKSAWEGFILQMNEAGGVGESLRKGIRFLAANLGTVLKVIGKVIKFFIVYKTTIAAMNAGNSKFVKSLLDMSKGFTKAGREAGAGAKGIKSFGKAISGIAIAGIVAGLLEIAQSWFHIASGAAEAERRVRSFNNSQKKGAEDAQAKVDARIRSDKEEIDAIRLKSAERVKAGESAVKVAKETEEAINAITDATKTQFTADEKRLRAAKIAAQQQKVAAKERRAEVLKAGGGRAEITLALTPQQQRRLGQLTILDEAVRKASDSEGAYAAKLAVTRDALRSVTDEVKEKTILQLEDAAATSAATKSTTKLNTALEKENELLSEQIELLHAIDQLDVEIDVRKIDEEIDALIDNASKLARETALLDVDPIEELINIKTQKLKDAAVDRRDFQISVLKEQVRIENETELAGLIDRRDKLLAQEGLNASQKKAINDQFDAELVVLEQNQLQRAADLELKIRLLKLQTSEEIIEITKAGNDEVNAINDELIDAQIEGAEKLSESKDEEATKDVKRAKRLQKLLNEIFKQGIDFFIKQSQRKQEQLDKEIEASRTEEDRLREAANAGNLSAEKSLKKQAQITNEKLAEKQREAKIEESLQQLGVLYDSIRSFMAQGDGPIEAGAKGFSFTNAIKAGAKKLFGFKKGGYTGDGGVDEVAGVTHGKEFVIDAKKTAELGLKGASMSDFDNRIASSVMFNQLNGSSMVQNVKGTVEREASSYMVERKLDELIKIADGKQEFSIDPVLRGKLVSGIVATVSTPRETKTYTSLFKRN